MPRQKTISTVTLGQRLDLPTGHFELIDAVALVDRASDLSGVDLQGVAAIALVQRTGNGAGIHQHPVRSGAERDVAIDHAGAVGREGQGIVAQGVGEWTAGATGARMAGITGAGEQGTSRLDDGTGEQQEGGARQERAKPWMKVHDSVPTEGVMASS